MSTRFALVVLLLVLPGVLCGFPAYIHEKYKLIRDGCEQTEKVDPTIIENARKGIFVPDQTFKCYIKCLFETLNLFRPDGTVDIDSIADLIPEELKAIYHPPVVKCDTVHGSDLCDTAYQTMYCYYENNKEHFDII